jgi:putative methanogenesis marker protein 3
MVVVHLDGTRMELPEGATLGTIIPDIDKTCSVAVIRPASAESVETRSVRLYTTAGEVVIELNERAGALVDAAAIGAFFSGDTAPEELPVGWIDRNTAAFGPFTSSIIPAKTAFRYDEGDLVLGCGGNDPRRSYLIFCKRTHQADYGAGKDGGIVGRVVSGRSVLDRWSAEDRIDRMERVISWEDRSLSFTSTDHGLVLEEGMQLVSHIAVDAEGWEGDTVDPSWAFSVEYLLLALHGGKLKVARSSSTHILDDRLIVTDVPLEKKNPRLEGMVTIRTKGSSRGGIYIYTKDIPASPAHTLVGRVSHGIELARIAGEGEYLAVRVSPKRFDLLGLPLSEAEERAGSLGIRATTDSDDSSRVVITQEPPTTLEALASGHVTLGSVALDHVIDIELFDDQAPRTIGIFREVSGLKLHNIGSMPFLFNFEEVFLFRPPIPTGTKIMLENTPTEEVPADMLAMTNDSCKGTGIVGVRISENSEFGPTCEPFGGTNIIGRVLEPEKLALLEEGGLVYVREAGR